MAALSTQSAQTLVEWYLKHKRNFPWREKDGKPPSPYYVWLAEIMSQQTVMAALLPYFHRFVEAFPDVNALAAASEEAVMEKWAGLGYYSRARNVHKAAKAIAEAGVFPKTLEGWLALPGVGPYTAAAVVSQCFGVAEPVWDGNVQRVMSRVMARADAHAPALKADGIAELRDTLSRAKLSPSFFNQGLMELGATVCTPKAPICGSCPIRRDCVASKQGRQNELPPPKARKQWVELKPRVWVFGREIQGETHYLLEQREQGSWFPGLWDFPSELGGAKEPLKPREFVSRRAEKLNPVRHTVTHHRIELQPLLLKADGNAIDGLRHGRWVPVSEILGEKSGRPIATTARKIIRQVFTALR